MELLGRLFYRWVSERPSVSQGDSDHEWRRVSERGFHLSSDDRTPSLLSIKRSITGDEGYSLPEKSNRCTRKRWLYELAPSFNSEIVDLVSDVRWSMRKEAVLEVLILFDGLIKDVQFPSSIPSKTAKLQREEIV